MTEDPFADWSERITLRNDAGAPSLVYSPAQATGGRPWADGVWVPPTAEVDEAARVAVARLPGWLLSTAEPTLAAALVAGGALERRHAHSMSALLPRPPSVEPPQPAPGLRIEPLTAAQLDRHAERLGAVALRAYPPGHPDARERDLTEMRAHLQAVARGEVLAPLTDHSRVALFDGELVGACLVVDRPGKPPHGGPWVLDVFREPTSPVPGIGTALLTAALAAVVQAGLPGLSLVVSAANARARDLYERLGFVEVLESWTLELPGPDGQDARPR